jgi:hypothetical protein
MNHVGFYYKDDQDVQSAKQKILILRLILRLVHTESLFKWSQNIIIIIIIIIV